jgi:hypothetical protein
MEESLPWVQKIEDAFLLYQRVIGGSKLRIDIQKARDARTAQGSVLEYGLEHHLGHFVSDVSLFFFALLYYSTDLRSISPTIYYYYYNYYFLKQLNKGIPTEHRHVDDYVERQSKVYNLLVEWLEDFRSRFGQHDEAQPTIDEVNQGLALYQQVVLASKRKIDLQKAIEARAPNSVLEYGLNFHLERFLSEVTPTSVLFL